MNAFVVLSLLASFIFASGLINCAGEKRQQPRYGPKYLDDDCGDVCKTYLQKMDFYHTKPILTGALKNWAYYLEDSPFTADDGKLTADCHGGRVDSTKFTRWAQPNRVREFDNTKFFIYAMTPASVPKNGDLTIEFEGTGETYKVNQNPFPKEITQLNDFRMANSIFSAFDFDTSMAFKFLLTNDRVYVVYSRYNYGWVLGQQYAAFTFVIPVKMRKPSDWHNMKIIFHDTKKQVSWRLDGREIFRLKRPGYRLDRQFMVIDFGGAEGPVFPKSVMYGFGTGSDLQAYPACKRSDKCCDCKFPTLRQALVDTGDMDADPLYNPLLGPNSPAVYWNSDQDANQDDHIWGQGASLQIKKLVVYQDPCTGRKC